MTTSPLKPTRRRLTRKQKLALAALIGSLAGMSCNLFPPAHQYACHIAAKVLGLLLGGG